MNKSVTLAALLFAGAAAFAQPPAPAPAPPPPPGQQPGLVPATAPPPGQRGGPQARRSGPDGGPPPPAMRGGAPMAAFHQPQGRWWGNPDLVQKIGVSSDQIKKMDDIMQQHRLKLVDLVANLEKQELILEPLVSADQPDETKVLAQIDKVAQGRAELEKANARLLLDIRRVLTPDQWQKLKAETPNAPRPARGPGHPRQE